MRSGTWQRLRHRRSIAMALALSAAACSTILTIDDESRPPVPPEAGTVSDATSSSDAAGIDGDTGTLSTTPPTQIVTTGRGDVRELAVDGADVFYTSHSTNILGRVPKVGGAPVDLVMSGLREPTNGLTLDDDFVWAASFIGSGVSGNSQFGVVRVPKEGGTVDSAMWGACGRVRGLTQHMNTVVWHEQCLPDPPHIIRASEVGPPSSRAASAFDEDGGYPATAAYGYVTNIGATAFFSNARDIYAIPVGFLPASDPSNTPVLVVSTAGPINALVAQGTVLYAQIGLDLVAIDPNSGTMRKLASVPAYDATQNAVSIKLALDGDYLYATSPTQNALLRVAKDVTTGAPAPVYVTDPKTVRAVAVDATHVYGSNAAGEIWRLAK